MNLTTSAEVKDTWSYTTTFLAYFHGVKRKTFILFPCTLTYFQIIAMKTGKKNCAKKRDFETGIPSKI
jgi:hypothetical protein